jgi:DNA-binding transcriptional LysR family regulator
MEDLAHIATFARVVKTGSFAAAARLLKITDSAASKHVARLEHSLGVRLLNRTTRKLSLTEAGSAYYEHCTRILQEIENSKRAIAELQAAPRGLLRVTVPVPLSRILAPMLQGFLARYPKVRLDLDANNRIVDLAEEGFDVAVRFARKLPPNVVARKLRSYRVRAYASNAYLKRAGAPKHPSDLAEHNCLNIPAALPGGVWRFERSRERAEVTVTGSLQSDMVEALQDLVVRGTGITLLPEDLGGSTRGLVPLLPDWEMAPADLYVVWLPSKHLAPKVRVFVDYLVERFGMTPSRTP